MPVYLLDCDPGIDDALALGYLLASPGTELIAVTTVFGNLRVEDAAANARRLLHLAGRSDIPVSVGAAAPLVAGYDPDRAAVVHHANGIGGVELPLPDVGVSGEEAWRTLARTAAERPGEVHVIAIGPLTNLALAIRNAPEIVGQVAHVTIMGGAALAPGNSTPAAEANIWHDPEAAQEVLAAGWPITVVPLDVTMQHVLEAEQVTRLAESPGAYGRAAGAMLRHYSRFYRGSLGREAAVLHDPLAVAIALGDVPLVVAPLALVEVDTTSGPARGATIFDLRSRYRGWPDHPEARTRVVIETGTGFADELVARLGRL